MPNYIDLGVALLKSGSKKAFTLILWSKQKWCDIEKKWCDLEQIKVMRFRTWRDLEQMLFRAKNSVIRE